MARKIVSDDFLFEVKDVLGRKIRTTKDYWQKIKTLKHRELKYGATEEVLPMPQSYSTHGNKKSMIYLSLQLKF